MAQDGKEAQENLESMLEWSKSLPPPFYFDLGLVYEINERLDEAEAMYKKAATLDMNKMYLKTITSTREAKEEQRKLVEQQRSREQRD